MSWGFLTKCYLAVMMLTAFFLYSVSECSISVAFMNTHFYRGETMKLTLLIATLMTAVVGITSANAADYKKLLLPPMQLIRANGGATQRG